MSTTVDATDQRPHLVYRCYGAGDVLLYVGVAQNVSDRLFHHMHQCNQFKQPNGTLQRHMVRHTAESFPTKALARDGERKAIREEAPLVNRQHNTRRFRKVNTSTYGLVEPVHPITAAAFPELPRIVQKAVA